MAKDTYLTGPALKKSLELMRKGPVSFAYAYGGSPDEDLFTIDRKKNPAALGKELNAASTGTKYASGKIFLEGRVLTLTLTKDQSGLAKRMTLFLRAQNMNLTVQVAEASGPDVVEATIADEDVVAEAKLEGVGQVKVGKSGKISVGPGDPTARLEDEKTYLAKRAKEIEAGFKLLRKQQQQVLMKALAEAAKGIKKGDIARVRKQLDQIEAKSNALSAETRAKIEDKELTQAASQVSSKENIETVKLQEKNWKSFLEWTKKHGDRVMPIPGTGVVYAGFPPDELLKWKKFLIKEEELKGVWAEIEKVDACIREWTGRTTFDKLSDVIKRVGAPLPEVVYTHGNLMGQPKPNFQNLDHVVSSLTSREDRFLDRGKHTAVWQELSRLYAANAKGEITVWEGKLKNGKQVNASRQLINTEIVTLLKRDDLPEDTRKVVQAIAKRHERYYKEQAAMILDTIKNAPSRIAEAAKG